MIPPPGYGTSEACPIPWRRKSVRITLPDRVERQRDSADADARADRQRILYSKPQPRVTQIGRVALVQALQIERPAFLGDGRVVARYAAGLLQVAQVGDQQLVLGRVAMVLAPDDSGLPGQVIFGQGVGVAQIDPLEVLAQAGALAAPDGIQRAG